MAYHDPYVPELKSFGLHNSDLGEALAGADVALIVTAHPGIDHDNIAATIPTVDFRGVTRTQRAVARPPADLPVPRVMQTPAHGGGGMKRLVIVADHSFVVHAIRLALRQTAGFQVVGFIDGRTPADAALTELRPDVVVVDDMQLPENAIARLREAAEHAPDAKRLLLTMRMDEEWLGEAFEAGADGVLSKSVHPVSMGTLLREISQGHVVQKFRATRTPVSQEDCPLTEREKEILGLAAEGYTNQRIARELWVTEQTVKFHLSNTYRKLGVANRTEATRYAYMHDLVIAQRERLAS